MKAKLEIVGAVMRIYSGDEVRSHEPFEVSLFVVGDEEVAILKGLKIDKGVLNKNHVRAINECLKEHGFKTAVWYRWVERNGNMIRKEIKHNIF